ncbi:hypothetical protein HK102_001622 [Quaeritorhiza haematococci]|nr:hypothetical protein HK102_001622 [Quaeritorhiza haematococci]
MLSNNYSYYNMAPSTTTTIIASAVLASAAVSLSLYGFSPLLLKTQVTRDRDREREREREREMKGTKGAKFTDDALSHPHQKQQHRDPLQSIQTSSSSSPLFLTTCSSSSCTPSASSSSSSSCTSSTSPSSSTTTSTTSLPDLPTLLISPSSTSSPSLAGTTDLHTELARLSTALSHCRAANRRLEAQLRLAQKKRTLLVESVRGLKKEVWREREARFVVEKCLMEKVRKMEMEIDFKDNELFELREKQRDAENLKSGLSDYDSLGGFDPTCLNGGFTRFASIDKVDPEDEEEEEEEGYGSEESYDSTNPSTSLHILTSFLTQSYVSSVSVSSIIVDLDDLALKHNFSHEQCLESILLSLFKYFEAKGNLGLSVHVQQCFDKYTKLLSTYIDTPHHQHHLLTTLEKLCVSNPTYTPLHFQVLKTLYKLELVDPPAVIEWHNSPAYIPTTTTCTLTDSTTSDSHESTSTAECEAKEKDESGVMGVSGVCGERLREDAKSFVQWLEAEEERANSEASDSEMSVASEDESDSEVDEEEEEEDEEDDDDDGELDAEDEDVEVNEDEDEDGEVEEGGHDDEMERASNGSDGMRKRVTFVFEDEEDKSEDGEAENEQDGEEEQDEEDNGDEDEETDDAEVATVSTSTQSVQSAKTATVSGGSVSASSASATSTKHSTTAFTT